MEATPEGMINIGGKIFSEEQLIPTLEKWEKQGITNVKIGEEKISPVIKATEVKLPERPELKGTSTIGKYRTEWQSYLESLPSNISTPFVKYEGELYKAEDFQKFITGEKENAKTILSELPTGKGFVEAKEGKINIMPLPSMEWGSPELTKAIMIANPAKAPKTPVKIGGDIVSLPVTYFGSIPQKIMKDYELKKGIDAFVGSGMPREKLIGTTKLAIQPTSKFIPSPETFYRGIPTSFVAKEMEAMGLNAEVFKNPTGTFSKQALGKTIATNIEGKVSPFIVSELKSSNPPLNIEKESLQKVYFSEKTGQFEFKPSVSLNMEEIYRRRGESLYKEYEKHKITGLAHFIGQGLVSKSDPFKLKTIWHEWGSPEGIRYMAGKSQIELENMRQQPLTSQTKYVLSTPVAQLGYTLAMGYGIGSLGKGAVASFKYAHPLASSAIQGTAFVGGMTMAGAYVYPAIERGEWQEAGARASEMGIYALAGMAGYSQAIGKPLKLKSKVSVESMKNHPKLYTTKEGMIVSGKRLIRTQKMTSISDYSASSYNQMVESFKIKGKPPTFKEFGKKQAVFTSYETTKPPLSLYQFEKPINMRLGSVTYKSASSSGKIISPSENFGYIGKIYNKIPIGGGSYIEMPAGEGGFYTPLASGYSEQLYGYSIRNPQKVYFGGYDIARGTSAYTTYRMKINPVSLGKKATWEQITSSWKEQFIPREVGTYTIQLSPHEYMEYSISSYVRKRPVGLFSSEKWIGIAEKHPSIGKIFHPRTWEIEQGYFTNVIHKGAGLVSPSGELIRGNILTKISPEWYGGTTIKGIPKGGLTGINATDDIIKAMGNKVTSGLSQMGKMPKNVKTSFLPSYKDTFVTPATGKSASQSLQMVIPKSMQESMLGIKMPMMVETTSPLIFTGTVGMVGLQSALSMGTQIKQKQELGMESFTTQLPSIGELSVGKISTMPLVSYKPETISHQLLSQYVSPKPILETTEGMTSISTQKITPRGNIPKISVTPEGIINSMIYEQIRQPKYRPLSPIPITHQIERPGIQNIYTPKQVKSPYITESNILNTKSLGIQNLGIENVLGINNIQLPTDRLSTTNISDVKEVDVLRSLGIEIPLEIETPSPFTITPIIPRLEPEIPTKKPKKKKKKPRKHLFKGMELEKGLLADILSVHETQVMGGTGYQPKPTKKLWKLGERSMFMNVPTEEMLKKGITRGAVSPGIKELAKIFKGNKKSKKRRLI